MQRIVVVGASLCGLRALETLRSEGFTGELVAIGDEPVMPYDRPPLSKQYLKASGISRRSRCASRARPSSTSTGSSAAARLRWTRRKGRRPRRRRTRRLRRGAPGDRDRSVHLPFERDLAGIHVLRQLADADALRAELDGASRVVVIGGGFIGMEAAATCRERGLDVAVVEAACPVDARTRRATRRPRGRALP